MADSQFRKDNHYVPGSYLRRWAGADGRLSAYRLLVSHPGVRAWDRKSPSGVAKLQHLYTRVLAGSETDEIERWLDAGFESPAQGVIDRVVCGARLSVEDYEVLARFVAAQDVRTPARLIEVLKRGEAHVSEILQDTVERSVREIEAIYRAGGSIKGTSAVVDHGLPARVRIEHGQDDSTSRIGIEMVVGRQYWLFSIRRLLTATLKHLQSHRWTVLRSPRGMQWLTSDDPVIKLNWHDSENHDFQGGWGSPGTEIMLPLDPMHLLYTRIGSRPPTRGTVLNAEEAQRIQRLIIQHAHRHLFAVAPDTKVERIRPRTVDAELFRQEAEQWRRWHDEQSAAERDLAT